MKKAKQRTRKSGAMRMVELGWKQMQLWIDPTVYEGLYQLARAERRTPSNLVRKLIEDAVKNSTHPTTAELARRAKAELNNEKW